MINVQLYPSSFLHSGAKQDGSTLGTALVEGIVLSHSLLEERKQLVPEVCVGRQLEKTKGCKQGQESAEQVIMSKAMSCRLQNLPLGRHLGADGGS